MLQFLVIVLFCYLGFKTLGLFFRIAWGAAKIAATVLLALSLPMLIGCLVFAGGILLAIPLALIAIAFGLLKACV